jgi:hypothetical protein
MFRKAILATVAWLVMMGPAVPDTAAAPARHAKHKTVQKDCDSDELLVAKKKKKKKHCKKKKGAKKKSKKAARS